MPIHMVYLTMVGVTMEYLTMVYLLVLLNVYFEVDDFQTCYDMIEELNLRTFSCKNIVL